MPQKDRIWGLTGGSGVGKSTAAEILGRLGALVIDADIAAREIVKPGTEAYNEIKKQFGEEYFCENGELDRKKLGRKVFSDHESLEKLNEITHPAITEYIKKIIDRNKDRRIVIDAAVLLECKELTELCGKIVVVCAEKNVRINRIMERDNLTYEAAQQRIEAQMPQEELIKSADIVWHNNEGKEELGRMVSDSWNK